MYVVGWGRGGGAERQVAAAWLLAPRCELGLTPRACHALACPCTCRRAAPLLPPRSVYVDPAEKTAVVDGGALACYIDADTALHG